MDEILEIVETVFQLKIHKQSLNYLFLKIRLSLNQQIIQTQNNNSIINPTAIQQSVFLTICSSILEKSSLKNTDLKKRYTKITNIFDSHLITFVNRMPWESLECLLSMNFTNPELFSDLLSYIYLLYSLMQESNNERTHKIRNFYHSILEKIHEETYLKKNPMENVVASTSSVGISFEFNCRTIRELMKSINLIYMADSRTQGSFNSAENAIMFEMIVNIQSFITDQLSEKFNPEYIHVLLEVNGILFH